MRAPGFWYPRQGDVIASLISVLLWPLSIFFRVGTYLRRLLAKKPYRSRVPVLCVGNVVAGGAGKTPTALALAQLLKERGQKPVFVTRGYGGSLAAQGEPVSVDLAIHKATDVGDEALLLAACAPTWVGTNRVAALRHAETFGTIVILDDGLQNPRLLSTASVLVIDGEVGIGNGFIMPAGPLRESFGDVCKRVHAVVIIGANDQHKIKERLTVDLKNKAFSASLQAVLPPHFPRSGKFVAFAGIARPQKFYTTAKALGLDLVATIDFADHHPFSEADIDMLRRRATESGARLLTTVKDAVRLPSAVQSEIVVLPVELTFAEGVADELLRALVPDLL